ncbi:hypothetical protein HG536_0A04250 [Torulaspora globosa]|uniref:Smr domain-containing protein n=1 Tax=Torulaspora globosa TaxID=48254 RepID=A0A7G3ZAS1_9SACH|nr:uncharacterized protein HG536_0A04250 [Torulaspora globosa]QLL30607.1 hypothetical protein HG536_0A04250 [Torulaspora globosa]
MPKGQIDGLDHSKSKVNELCDVFPDKKRSEVINALESANGDLQNACTILLAESTGAGNSMLEDSPDPLQELELMFPDVDPSKIGTIYDRCQSIETAITELLSLPLLRLEDDEEQKRAERQVQTSQSADSSGAAKEGTAWKSVSHKIKTIQRYTDVPDCVARQAFHECSFDITRAIIKLVWTTDYYGSAQATRMSNDDSKEQKPLQNPRGGKVQSAKGFAHSTKNVFDKLDHETEITPQPRCSDDMYMFPESSAKFEELEEILQSNPTMRSISKAFLKRALTFYRGNLSMTTSLALHIIEADLQSATYKSRVDFLDMEKGFKISAENFPRRQATSSGPNKPSTFDPLELQNDEHYRKSQEMIAKIFDVPRLDFHGFTPKNAIIILEICLDKWWMQELSEREMNRQKLSISRALNVVPLKVITGRGIHSVGGVSTLKIRVRRYLNDNNYLYSEESAYFIIEGKK